MYAGGEAGVSVCVWGKGVQCVCGCVEGEGGTLGGREPGHSLSHSHAPPARQPGQAGHRQGTQAGHADRHKQARPTPTRPPPTHTAH